MLDERNNDVHEKHEIQSTHAHTPTTEIKSTCCVCSETLSLRPGLLGVNVRSPSIRRRIAIGQFKISDAMSTCALGARRMLVHCVALINVSGVIIVKKRKKHLRYPVPSQIQQAHSAGFRGGQQVSRPVTGHSVIISTAVSQCGCR